jgi:hypothetical protein
MNQKFSQLGEIVVMHVLYPPPLQIVCFFGLRRRVTQ